MLECQKLKIVGKARMALDPSNGSNLEQLAFIIIYFIFISKTNDNNKAPEEPIDMRMKKDNKVKV